MRLAFLALLALAGCKAQEPGLAGRAAAELAPVRTAVQEGLGLLDCSRAAIPLQPGYAEQELRHRALIERAEALGLGAELDRWRSDYRAAMATADLACFPKQIADNLKLVNDRLEAALEELG